MVSDSQATFQAGLAPGGLLGRYYNNIDLTDLVLARPDSTIDFAWGAGSPDPAIDPGTFSVQWTGKIVPSYSEVYTFTFVTSDGFRFWIDGEIVVENPSDHGITINGGQIALTAGQLHDIRIEYYENSGDARIRVLWRSASQRQEVISTNQLYGPVTPESTPPQVVDVAVAGAAWTGPFIEHLADSGLGQTGYSILHAPDGEPPLAAWTEIDQVRVQFSEDVLVAADALTLSGENQAEYEFADFSYDPATLTAVWTLAQPIGSDRLEIDILDAAFDLSGNQLDADGSGTPGGSKTLALDVIPGDVTRNGHADLFDLIAVRDARGTFVGSPGYSISLDVDGSGSIDRADLAHMLRVTGTSLPARLEIPRQPRDPGVEPEVRPPRDAGRRPRSGSVAPSLAAPSLAAPSLAAAALATADDLPLLSRSTHPSAKLRASRGAALVDAALQDEFA
jgi:hypothetical protein